MRSHGFAGLGSPGKRHCGWLALLVSSEFAFVSLSGITETLPFCMQELADFPFPWASQLTNSHQEKDVVCRFLATFGVHKSGLWQRECPCDSSWNWGGHAPCFPESVAEGHPLPNFAKMVGLSRRDAPCFQAKVRTSFRPAISSIWYEKKYIGIWLSVRLQVKVWPCAIELPGMCTCRCQHHNTWIVGKRTIANVAYH